MRGMALEVASLLALAAHGATAQQADDAVAHPDLWPEVPTSPAIDANVEARIDRILARMSVADKVGQLIQADIGSIAPKDLETYKLGSVLNGGNSGPGGDDFAPPAQWLRAADAFYAASMKRTGDGPRIPVIWGTDAVHGNNNLTGATLFPHNIGLGAARDPELMREIGHVTAVETAAAGQDWSFAPTLAVVRDDRWGRTYESYSEDPAIVASYAGKVVTGLQGEVGTKGFMAPGTVVATAKHFLGDGGTGGKDQGDTKVPETELVAIHNAGYPPALKAGTLTVMTSFSSWNGKKILDNKSLITDVLKDRMGFGGFVVGDWNAHAQVPGCSVTSCAKAINDGLDMFMVSGDWKALYRNTLAQVKSGEISHERLDDAVRRILRVKIAAGLFDAGPPSSRPYAGKFALIGAPEHRAVARRAVRESLVLLKNNGHVLPLKPDTNILVAGSAAKDIARQAGGWSITWQGTRVPASAFPNAQSIWSGIEQTVERAGGNAEYAADGTFATRPDAAIVVFGEKPYAEFMGDRPNLEFVSEYEDDLAILRSFKRQDIPVVAVFLSGRPMWVNREINASDAFVAAWLPGSEGGGVADMLFAREDGKPADDFRGKLSFSWPKRPDQFVLNKGDAGYDPLFPFGYGLTYADETTVPMLDETRPKGMDAANSGPMFTKGAVPDGWQLALAERDQNVVRILGNEARTAGGALRMTGVDRDAQEDSRRFAWSGSAPAELRIEAAKPVDLSREANGQVSLVVDYRVDAAPTAPVTVGMQTGRDRMAKVPITATLRSVKPGAWHRMAIPIACFVDKGLDAGSVAVPFAVGTAGGLTMSISDIRVASVEADRVECGRE